MNTARPRRQLLDRQPHALATILEASETKSGHATSRCRKSCSASCWTANCASLWKAA
jgi:hypothetical protein